MKKLPRGISQDNNSVSDNLKAVALQYDDPCELPRILASGVDELADSIIALARKNDIPIHQDGALANLLAQSSPGDTITKKSFRLVAEVISFLYHSDQEWRQNHKKLKTVLE